jgi:hypothetical protein
MVAIKFLTNRRDTYLNDNSRTQENIIHQILHNNYGPTFPQKPAKTPTQPDKPTPDNKWTRFTYFRKETRFITKLFKNTSVKVTYTTRNTINRLLSAQNHMQKDKYEKLGVYRLTCPECKKAYVGQTGRSYSDRFCEHFRDYKYANSKSKFAKHLLNHHSFGPIHTTMVILHLTSKGTMMNRLERLHIYSETNRNNQINYHHTVKPNAIFDSILHLNSAHTAIKPTPTFQSSTLPRQSRTPLHCSSNVSTFFCHQTTCLNIITPVYLYTPTTPYIACNNTAVDTRHHHGTSTSPPLEHENTVQLPTKKAPPAGISYIQVRFSFDIEINVNQTGSRKALPCTFHIPNFLFLA